MLCACRVASSLEDHPSKIIGSAFKAAIRVSKETVGRTKVPKTLSTLLMAVRLNHLGDN
jgi:hypothetical protein